MFRAPAMLLPHESTVAHEQRFVLEPPILTRSQRSSVTTPSSEVPDEIKDLKHHPKVRKAKDKLK